LQQKTRRPDGYDAHAPAAKDFSLFFVIFREESRINAASGIQMLKP
jgi:hypothetical protein